MLKHHHAAGISPERVVILGESGFVARDLAHHLSQQKIPFLAIGARAIDLLQPESVMRLKGTLKQGDALVVTAGLTPEKGKDVGTLMKNLLMIQHLAAVLETTRCAHVVYVSSDAVYGTCAALLRESSPRQAADLYGLMHIAREQMLTFAVTKSTTPICIFCPCAIYGAGDTHGSYGPNRFLHTAMRDRVITLFGGGEDTRDHIYIEDVSRLLTLCLLHRSEGIINAVSGNAVTFREVAALIRDLVGNDVRIATQERQGPATYRPFDVTQRIKAFPAFVPTPLREGLAESFLRLTEVRRE